MSLKTFLFKKCKNVAAFFLVWNNPFFGLVDVAVQSGFGGFRSTFGFFKAKVYVT